ncbi:MAG: nitrile hydratase subunit beta, partial [Proteobacteria bacterium]|nr:nitrile hydratase subunit beta [Pseudomonadota bacterium]
MSYVSHADLGGTPCRERVDAVDAADAGPPFHARWEARVHGLTLAMGASGAWNLDMSRAARETLPDYASLPYFGRWLRGLERLLDERGLVSAA